MGWNPEIPGEIQWATVDDKLSENVWGGVVAQYAAHGLDLGHDVKKVMEESLPYSVSGPADHQDMFYGVFGGIT